jgi:hypothetical protein
VESNYIPNTYDLNQSNEIPFKVEKIILTNNQITEDSMINNNKTSIKNLRKSISEQRLNSIINNHDNLSNNNKISI